jgi:Uma2 family endonuclease
MEFSSIDSISDQYVLLPGIPWKQYEVLMNALGEHHLRHTYCEGALEFRREVCGVTWKEYTGFLDALEDRPLRHIYDQGYLLMMAPLKEHEWTKRLIGRMLEAITMDQQIPIQSLSSTTILAPQIERSFQADEAYYIQNEGKVRGKNTFEPGVDPPPDLIIEVDVTSDSKMQLELFSRMKVPEVWIYREPELRFLRRLRNGKYRAQATSLALPFLKPHDIKKFLERRTETDESSLIAAFVRYARKLIKNQSK